MAISPLGQTPAAPQRSAAPTADNPATPRPRPDPRAEQNRALLQAQERVSLQAGNESMSLVFRAAIDAINERLAPELGDQAIERAYDSGLDVSPEATAERIVSLTTALFPRFQSIHPGLENADQVNRFVELIRDGIEQGFKEARDILDGLDVLKGGIADNIDRTFDLAMQGLDDFRARLLGEASDAASGPAPESGAGDVLSGTGAPGDHA